MRLSAKSIRTELPALSLSVLPPVIITAFFWSTSENDITIFQWLLASVLLLIPWYSYRKWSVEKRGGLPIFAMISFMYWLYYALPLFGDEITMLNLLAEDRVLSDESITTSLAMAVLGVSCLWLGMKMRFGRRWVPRNIPDIPTTNFLRNYLRVILIVGTLLSVYEVSPYVFGEGGRQIILIFQSIVPAVAFVIFFRNYLIGESTNLDKALIVFFLIVRTLVGISTGWLGTLALLMITCVAAYMDVRRKIPRWPVVVLVIFILFFQVGKENFRKKYWTGGEQASKIERVTFWVDESLAKWGEALDNPTKENLRELTYKSISRLSLLTQTANVIELTPSAVPYQYGSLYSYMVITLIPRFVWPDKPTINEANQFYQVTYGLTSSDDLGGVSMAVGFMAEGYINFGWPGVMLIMFMLGLFLDFYQKAFLAENSGTLLKGIGIVLLPQFLTIESQLAVYIGGLAQQVFFILLVMLPIIRFRQLKQAVSVRVRAA